MVFLKKKKNIYYDSDGGGGRWSYYANRVPTSNFPAPCVCFQISIWPKSQTVRPVRPLGFPPPHHHLFEQHVFELLYCNYRTCIIYMIILSCMTINTSERVHMLFNGIKPNEMVPHYLATTCEHIDSRESHVAIYLTTDVWCLGVYWILFGCGRVRDDMSQVTQARYWLQYYIFCDW